MYARCDITCCWSACRYMPWYHCYLWILSLFTSDKGGGICFRPHARARLSVCLCARLLKNACMYLDEMLRVDTWTNWLTFEPDPDHSSEFQEPDSFLRYRICYVTLQPCCSLAYTVYLGQFGVFLGHFHINMRQTRTQYSNEGPVSWIWTCIQNCKADSAKSNGRISMKFYEWRACESRKTAFNFGSDTDGISAQCRKAQYWVRCCSLSTQRTLQPIAEKHDTRLYYFTLSSHRHGVSCCTVGRVYHRCRPLDVCVEFYLYPTVGTVLIHSVKPELTE